MLERWLAELSQSPPVAMSREFKEFLAYEDDGSSAFARRRKEYHVPGEQGGGGGRNKMEKASQLKDFS